MYLTKLGCASSESVFDLSFHDNVYFEDDNSTDDPEYVPESQGLNKLWIISINNSLYSESIISREQTWKKFLTFLECSLNLKYFLEKRGISGILNITTNSVKSSQNWQHKYQIYTGNQFPGYRGCQIWVWDVDESQAVIFPADMRTLSTGNARISQEIIKKPCIRRTIL